jgi:hypothetical protein
MAENRKTTRQALATALEASVTAATAVYDHKPVGLNGATPVLAIESVTSERTLTHFGGVAMTITTARYLIHIFVRRPDASAAELWTKSAADNQLDDMETAVAGFIESNQTGASWDGISYAAPTAIDDGVVLDGTPYINEQILIEVSLK